MGDCFYLSAHKNIFYLHIYIFIADTIFMMQATMRQLQLREAGIDGKKKQINMFS